MEILTFLENRGFVLEDWFGICLALVLAHVGRFLALFGALRSVKVDLETNAVLSQLCPKIEFQVVLKTS